MPFVGRDYRGNRPASQENNTHRCGTERASLITKRTCLRLGRAAGTVRSVEPPVQICHGHTLPHASGAQWANQSHRGGIKDLYVVDMFEVGGGSRTRVLSCCIHYIIEN